MANNGLIVSESRGATVVDFRDEAVLDAPTAERVAAELYGLVDVGKKRKILLDLSAVRFLASQMIGTLVTLHKKATNIDGRVVLCGLAGNLMRVFEASRLDGVLHFAGDVEAGLAAMDAPDAAPAEAAAPAPPRWGIKGVIQKQVRILFSGAMVLVPLAITVWVIWTAGSWLDDLGRRVTESFGRKDVIPHGVGALILIATMYFVGLLTHLWLFRGLFGLLERLLTRVPGVKTIYESVRDLMKLFGGDSKQMGRVVQYTMPDGGMSFLGILTNENPLGMKADDPNRKVAVFLPMSYMIGGPTALVSPGQIADVDMSVEQCMKACATAQVGNQPILGAAAAMAARAKGKRTGRPWDRGTGGP